jgi:hypothetical protein
MKSLIVMCISTLCLLLLMNCSESTNQSSINISGVVRNSDGYVKPDIEVTLFNEKKYYTTFTDNKGNYYFNNVTKGIPIVRPTEPGYSYNPEKMQLTMAGSNLSNINFTATQSKVYLYFDDGNKFYKLQNYYLRDKDVLSYFYDSQLGQYVLEMYCCYLRSSDLRDYGMYFYIFLGKNPQISNAGLTYAYAEIWNYLERYTYTAGSLVGKGSGTINITYRTSNQIMGTFAGKLISDSTNQGLTIKGKFDNKFVAGALKKFDINL